MLFKVPRSSGLDLATSPGRLGVMLPMDAFTALFLGTTGLLGGVITAVDGIVAWPETLAMMAGALIGGFVGGRSMRFLPAHVFRMLVVGMGAILTIVFAWRYWKL